MNEFIVGLKFPCFSNAQFGDFVTKSILGCFQHLLCASLNLLYCNQEWNMEPIRFLLVLNISLLLCDFNFQGWTLYEVLRYAPEHNWNAYEEALKTHPVLAKMAISGIVYSVGDWIAQVSISRSQGWNRGGISIFWVHMVNNHSHVPTIFAVLWREAPHWVWSSTHV